MNGIYYVKTIRYGILILYKNKNKLSNTFVYFIVNSQSKSEGPHKHFVYCTFYFMHILLYLFKIENFVEKLFVFIFSLYPYANTNFIALQNCPEAEKGIHSHV